MTAYSDYLDLDIDVEEGRAGEYPVKARSRDRGQVNGLLRLRQAPATALLLVPTKSGAGERGVSLLPPGLSANRSGRELFDALFSGEIGDLYNQCLGQLHGSPRRLRIRLHIRASELAAEPWECLEDRKSGDSHLALRYVSIVRDVPGLQDVSRETIRGPIRILGMAAEVKGLDALNSSAEKERIQKALEPLLKRGQVELEWVPGSRARDLKEKLEKGPWHVIHYIGHGDFKGSGQLILSDDSGNPEPLDAERLSVLLRPQNPEDTPRLVVLNACRGAESSRSSLFTSLAASLAAREIPAVVAMRDAVRDDMAVAFAQEFYRVLADGGYVDAAVSMGRAGMRAADHTKSSLQWSLPVLYMRGLDYPLFKEPAKQAAKGGAAPEPARPAAASEPQPEGKTAYLVKGYCGRLAQWELWTQMVSEIHQNSSEMLLLVGNDGEAHEYFLDRLRMLRDDVARTPPLLPVKMEWAAPLSGDNDYRAALAHALGEPGDVMARLRAARQRNRVLLIHPMLYEDNILLCLADYHRCLVKLVSETSSEGAYGVKCVQPIEWPTRKMNVVQRFLLRRKARALMQQLTGSEVAVYGSEEPQELAPIGLADLRLFCGYPHVRFKPDKQRGITAEALAREVLGESSRATLDNIIKKLPRYQAAR